MENSSNFHEKSDVGFHPSPSVVGDQNDDQSATDFTGFSPLSGDSYAYCKTWTSSEASNFSESMDDTSYASEPSPSRWTAMKPGAKKAVVSRPGMKLSKHSLEDKLEDHDHLDSAEIEMMKERFAKLLLGEDMSGGGKGVCTAVTISNAITNLYATMLGQNLKLEPLKPEKKAIWRREMNFLLSVCDYIVEFAPTAQYLEDGTIVEMMKSRPRSDLYINLPALKKLDSMLIEILDTFEDSEFWYAENIPGSSTHLRAGSFRRIVKRKDEKWWLPVPCVLPGGLSEKSRKHLREKRDCAIQIHKAAMAINSNVLEEIDIPETYLENLPKSGRASLGDTIYHYMSTADNFSPDRLCDCLKISSDSEHEVLELIDRVESSMYAWRRKACLSHSKSSWKEVKNLMADTEGNDKNHMLAERAEALLFCLKQRYPELSQTSLDTCKIQYNRDVGKAILEGYSRVLEGLAFNIVAWIEDVLYVDKSMKDRDV